MSSPPGGIDRAARPKDAPLHLDVDLDIDQALAAVAEAAELWGADWQRDGTGGRLVLPVLAGIRHGVLVGEIRATRREGKGSQLRFDVEHSEYTIHRGALMLLALGALGGFGTILAPLSLELLALAPIALVLMLLAWFLVLSKVKHHNVQDFFDTTAGIAASGAPKGGED